MTTETAELQERIAEELYYEQHPEGRHRSEWPAAVYPDTVHEYRDLAAAAVLPIIRAELRAAQAEAWHHGFQEGYCLEPRPDWANALSNPYRATKYETGGQA